jgi:hypothetical protein
MGWSSAGLATAGESTELWTVAEAATLLGPPQLTTAQVRALVRMASLEPVAKRRTTAHGVPGRHARVYRASELIELYNTLLTVNESKGKVL